MKWLLSASLLAAFPVVTLAAEPVTVETFPRAETHDVLKSYAALGALGKFYHIRELTPIDQQNVVRMNRDTLYSGMILDLSEPATLIKPDTGDRYQSILVINEEHFARMVAYEPGEYELTREKVGSRYASVIVRTLVDAEDPKDMAAAHELQDRLQVRQSSKGTLELPEWDQEAQAEIRDALKVLGARLGDRTRAYGKDISDVAPLAYLIATADAWGGWKPKNAAYLSFVPKKDDGATPHTLTLKNVPSGDNAFWSISVYNDKGFFQENEYAKYVVNSRKAIAAEGGSVTIHFGGDPDAPNFLPIMKNWNYMLRIYLPKAAYFDGSWKVPGAVPASK